MKLKTLTTVALLTALGLVAPRVAISQPSPTGDYEPGYWQPEATIANINQPINITLINDTGITLHYGYSFQRLLESYGTGPDVVFPDGDTDSFSVHISSNEGDLASINVYDPSQPEQKTLRYQYNTSGNNLLVRVSLDRQEPETVAASSAVYIDERGRVYTFR